MKKVLIPMLATLFVVGCSDSDEASNLLEGETAPQAEEQEAPVSVDVELPDKEVPDGTDDLQACLAIDGVSLTDLSGKIIELTTKSMSDPYGVNSTQCIPADSEIPVDNDGFPKFIVIDLYDISGVDLVNLISEQLLPIGEYTSMALSVLQGSYGDFLDTPYSYVGNPVDKLKMDIVDDLKFDGLNINVDVPTTFTMSFDVRSMIQLVNDAYVLKSEGFRVVDNLLAGKLFGDIDASSCVESAKGAYVYLYPSDSEQYGDLGSDYAPAYTAKVQQDNTYSVDYVQQGEYDLVLVCDALMDLPNEIDLDIDLDGEAVKYQNQYVEAGGEAYRNL